MAFDIGHKLLVPGSFDFDRRSSNSASSEAIDRLSRKVEQVLAQRTDRVLLVLERCTDNQNYLACLRTAESLGIQKVYIVKHVSNGDTAAFSPRGEQATELKKRGRIARQSAQWLTVKEFATTSQCIQTLLEEDYQIWATDLAEGAQVLDEVLLANFPLRVAVVMGREADGVSPEMLAAAHRRVALPTYGFNASLNVSVATGMVLQRLLLACPEARGNLSEAWKAELRLDWYQKLAKTDQQRMQLLGIIDGQGSACPSGIDPA